MMATNVKSYYVAVTYLPRQTLGLSLAVLTNSKLTFLWNTHTRGSTFLAGTFPRTFST